MLGISIIFLATLFAITSAFPFNELSIDARIIQGENATRGQFPFYTFLKTKVEKGYALCGASLISDEWIVTAAHCVYGGQFTQVHLGSLRAADLQEEGRLILNVSKEEIFIHSEYDQIKIINDIALIHLPQKIEFTEYIQPITLACKSSPGLITTAIGNGLTESDATHIAPILQYTTLTTISMNRCAKTFKFRNGVICVIGREQHSICSGDSGGPLVNKKTGALIGATSFGAAIGCHLGFPQGFTDLTKFLPWIEKISGVSNCK